MRTGASKDSSPDAVSSGQSLTNVPWHQSVDRQLLYKSHTHFALRQPK